MSGRGTPDRRDPTATHPASATGYHRPRSTATPPSSSTRLTAADVQCTGRIPGVHEAASASSARASASVPAADPAAAARGACGQSSAGRIAPDIASIERTSRTRPRAAVTAEGISRNSVFQGSEVFASFGLAAALDAP